MFPYELLTANDCSSCAITRGTTLKFSQGILNLGRGQNLIQCVNVSKLTVGVVDAVAMVLLGYLREVLHFGTILLDVLKACIAEKPWGHGLGTQSADLLIFLSELGEGIRSILKEILDRTCEHFIEAQRQDAVSLPAPDCLTGQIQCCATSGAIIVDIEDRDTSDAHSVNGTLARRRISIHITNIGLLNLIVFEISIAEGPLNRSVAEVVVVKVVFAWFQKVCHTVSNHENSRKLLFRFFHDWLIDILAARPSGVS